MSYACSQQDKGFRCKAALRPCRAAMDRLFFLDPAGGILYNVGNQPKRGGKAMKKVIVHKSAAPIYIAAAAWGIYALVFPLYRVGHLSLRRRCPWRRIS